MIGNSSASSSRWFAVYTASRHEKHVSQQLKERQVESFLPLYRTRRVWKNRARVDLELPLFPNYVFVRMTSSDRSRALSVPGVLSLVGSKHEAWPLPEFEIEAIRSGVHQRSPEPHPYLVVGEKVRISSGPLQGMEGVLLRKANGLRVVMSLDQIAQSFSVDVDAREIGPVQPGSTGSLDRNAGLSRDTSMD
jgi:transcription antitermination factor NusG